MLNLLKTFRPIAADFLSTIIFIVVIEFTHNVVLATSVGIASGFAQFLWYKLRGKNFALMQWASFILVIVLGGATIYTQDGRFMEIKPSIAGFAIACVMLQRGWQLRYIPEVAKGHLSEGFMVAWGYAWSALYFALAGANLYFALRMPQQAWITFTAFVPTAAPLTLFAIQYVSMRAAVIRKVRSGAAAVPAE
ncbi:MAG TPA: septation protein IspZ [Rhizomicrobium sp.]|jgi:intracellular septation protein A